MRLLIRAALLSLIALSLLPSCAIIGPGERGVKRTLGDLDDVVHAPGVVWFNFFITSVVRLPVRSQNLEVHLPLPSREGLTVKSEISILYRIKPEAVPKVLEDIGTDYERSLVLPIFRSAAADISARHNAKDMHSKERSAIEQEIAERMRAELSGRGFEIERVLLKSIVLPPGLSAAIEQKLAAEQEAQRMQYVLDRERREAERRRVEAEGIKDAQLIIDGGLTPMLIQYRSLEAFRELAQSPNAKVIITDGKAPLLLGGVASPAPPAQ
ncbi:MAG: prohibitin family protein [Myxococcales bacterium]|nr:prohibitin family protein [Myxococcales bacterium]MCB9525264.1 prohibitin family protein [Myxococcales bacterium]